MGVGLHRSYLIDDIWPGVSVSAWSLSASQKQNILHKLIGSVQLKLCKQEGGPATPPPNPPSRKRGHINRDRERVVALQLVEMSWTLPYNLNMMERTELKD